MQKILQITILIGIFVQITSCKDEEGPATVISFSTATSTVGEGAGTISVLLSLDRAPSKDLTVNFTMTGSAKIDDDYTSTASATISAGATEGALSITIVDDALFEFDEAVLEVFGETIQITLSGVSGNGILSEIPSQVTHLLVIQDNEPLPKGLDVDLSWDSGDGTAGNVDMDLLLWFMNPAAPNESAVVLFSQQIGTAFERIEIPTAVLPDGTYGLTFRYFEGDSDNLTFTAKFTTFNGVTLEGGLTEATYGGVYTQVNVNGDESATVQIEQTFVKQGAIISEISDITIPDAGSRQRIFSGVAPPRK